jgi:hypothetical protein
MILASEELNAALEKRNVLNIFYALQNILNASANISKALWGQRGKFASERKHLRESIGVNDESPLRNVTMRNNFEHFDERLDRWWKESKQHNMADFNLGAIGGIAEIDSFRCFDPRTSDVSFWGQNFNVQNLIDEVCRILPKLEAEANKPHWETGPEPQEAGNGNDRHAAKLA